jgi:hypothetical protein
LRRSNSLSQIKWCSHKTPTFYRLIFFSSLIEKEKKKGIFFSHLDRPFDINLKGEKQVNKRKDKKKKDDRITS